jgi:hypothetical protein
MIRSLRRTALLGAALAAALLGGVTPAVAAPAAPAATAATCTGDAYWGGEFICNTDILIWTYPSGKRQIFGIGTDYAVWTRWELGTSGLSPWTSMGGQAVSGVYYQSGSGYAPTIRTVGFNGSRYYNTRNASTTKWSGWYL